MCHGSTACRFLSDTCDPRIRAALRIRALRLCCLTSHYADLWREICTGQLPPPARPEPPRTRRDVRRRRRRSPPRPTPGPGRR